MEPDEGLVPQAAEFSGGRGLAEEADEFAFGGVDLHGSVGRRRGAGTTGAAGGEKRREPQFGFDVGFQAGEVPVVAEEAGKTAAGGGVLGAQILRKRAIGCRVGEEPLQRETVVER